MPSKTVTTMARGGHNRIPVETERLVCDLYQAGATITEIVQRAGVAQLTVYKILDRYNIPRRVIEKGRQEERKLRRCVQCRDYPAYEDYALCVRCRAVTAIKREQAVRRVQRAMA